MRVKDAGRRVQAARDDLAARIEPALDPLERATVRERHEQRVVAGDRARDLGPACPVERRRDRVGRPRQRPDDEEQPGLVDLDREVGQELAEAVLARRLGLDEARRKGVGGGPLAGDLDQPELGDVAGDRRLGRPEAPLAEARGELLLGPDRPLVDEVADRPLAELLHHLHRRRAARRQRSHATTTTAARTSR